MYKDKGILTEDELKLISRYPNDIQAMLKERLLDAKERNYNSYSYDKWIDYMEQGLKITFDGNVTLIAGLNSYKFARVLLEYYDGIKRQPLKEEFEYDSRLEYFKQYPKGTRVKANGEIY
jgi:hypothetical protein